MITYHCLYNTENEIIAFEMMNKEICLKISYYIGLLSMTIFQNYNLC